MSRDVRDLVDGVVEGGLVGGGRLRGATDLADVLQCSGVHLVTGRRRFEVVQGSDIPAHDSTMPRQTVRVEETSDLDREMEVAVEREVEKRVSWAELFFDLVFVVAVTQVSHFLVGHVSWGRLLQALIVFVPIYWLWVGTSIQTNLQDISRPGLRIRIFAIALAGIFMAMSLPEAYGRLGLLFAFSYWLGRLVIGVGMVHAAVRGHTWPVNPYTVSIAITGPMLIVGALVHGDAREVIWGVAALIDLSTPTVLRRFLRVIHYDAGHLTERFGLFVLIALGESVVSVGTSADAESLTAAQGFAVAAAFVLSCGLWWVYFHFAADAMRHALATAKVQLDITRLVLSYGHLSFIAAIILVAVGMHESIIDPTHHLSWALSGLLVGGAALYLASFGFTRWAMFRLVSWTRLSAAAALLLMLPIAPHVPALATLTGLAFVLIILNTVELMRVGQIGWAALLRRRELAG
jgi:low temperature requirement protein LtrA